MKIEFRLKKLISDMDAPGQADSRGVLKIYLIFVHAIYNFDICDLKIWMT